SYSAGYGKPRVMLHNNFTNVDNGGGGEMRAEKEVKRKEQFACPHCVNKVYSSSRGLKSHLTRYCPGAKQEAEDEHDNGENAQQPNPPGNLGRVDDRPGNQPMQRERFPSTPPPGLQEIPEDQMRQPAALQGAAGPANG
ncbi:hypothetical protein PENTCL1PPCAC_29258, partial [Pristionchus entomophagus]